jgi:glycine cleavage system H lipoate-binding protein
MIPDRFFLAAQASTYVSRRSKVSSDHIWMSLESSQGIVGITDHATKNLCPLVLVELSEVGSPFARQKVFEKLSPLRR